MKKKKIKNSKSVIRVVQVGIFLALAAFIFSVAPNYKLNYVKNKVNLIINNRNVTMVSQRKDVYIDEKDVIYLSFEDMSNYFDKYLTYDEQNERLITTYDAKEASMKLNERQIYINGIKKSILSPLIKREDGIYLPLSEMEEIYNIDIDYVQNSNIIAIESRDRKLTRTYVSKNVNIKTVAKDFARTVEKVKKGQSLTLVSVDKGWARVRTEDGRLGYVKEKHLANKIDVRDDLEKYETKIQGKVVMFWDYYSKYAKAPDRTGTSFANVNAVSPAFFELENADGEIRVNIGDAGKKYIEWAKENNYQIWPMLSNSTVSTDKDITSKIMNDYNLRQQIIENIIELVIEYKLDGINIDFENMYKEDKDMFSRFIIELEPRMKEYGKILTVDVTAPEGSDTWSLCYDRNIIADVSDYIIFMAYDQNRTTIGTVSGYNWIEENINKFIENEKVPAEKIILALPFYTRVWTQDQEGKVISEVVNMKSVDELLSKNNVTEKEWLEDVKQNYIQYDKNGRTYQMWVEDERSLKEKMELINKYNLAGVSFWEKDREIEGFWEKVQFDNN